MKQNRPKKLILLSIFLFFLPHSRDLFAYKESDFYKLKNTKKCINCDLTELNLSRLNLRKVNLSGSNLSGSNLSESDLSESNLSRVNLSRVNLNGTNLKNINITGSNLNRIIIDFKALSTLDFSESTFFNKYTIAEEENKKKKRMLRKKRENKKELKKRREKPIRKKMGRELKKKKELALSKNTEKAVKTKEELELSYKKKGTRLKQSTYKKSMFLNSDKKCYIAIKSSEDFEPSVLSIISISLISKFLNEVEQIPPGGIPRDSCQYQISVTKNNKITTVNFRGEGLNSSGNSNLFGIDGFQQSILKSLFRSLKNKRSLICQDYGTLLEECGEFKIKKRQSAVLFGREESKLYA